MSAEQVATKVIGFGLGISKSVGESSKKDESNATTLSNMSVQYYYKMKPKESEQDISAQYIIDNIDTSNNNIRKPDSFLYDYEIIGKVITRKIKHMVSSLEAFIILKETENPADNNKKITHFMGLNFNKELTIDKNPTLYNHLFGVPEFEITDDNLNLKYTIYNKRFYDDI
jgi:hypothetical protein